MNRNYDWSPAKNDIRGVKEIKDVDRCSQCHHRIYFKNNSWHHENFFIQDHFATKILNEKNKPWWKFW